MKNYVGTIIKALRTENGLTQRELAKDICSLRQLIRIEANENAPSTFLMQAFSAKLGDDLMDYMPYFLEENGYVIKRALEKAYLEYNHQNYKAVLEQIEPVSQTNYIQSKFIRQKVEWIGISASICLNEHEAQEMELLKTLRLTKDIQALDEIFQFNLTKVELELVSAIIFSILKGNEAKKGERLLNKLIEYIENQFKASMTPVYISGLLHHASIQLRDGKHEKAIESVEKGIRCGTKYNQLSLLDRLYNIGGRAYYKLGNQAKGQQYLITYILMAQNKAQGKELDEIYETLVDHYYLDSLNISDLIMGNS